MGALAQAMLMTRKSVAAGIPAIVGHPLLYTGNGGTNPIGGSGISPDLVIMRDRAGGTGLNWHAQDNVRGAGLSVFPSTSGAEVSITGISSFDANGFTLGSATTLNDSGKNYLALLLQRVASAFDIVTYTGTGSATTVAHGLGVVPELIIVKNRSLASRNWAVYAAANGNTKSMFLNGDNPATVRNDWNNTDPTSSVFSVSSSALTNDNTRNHVAYLFATLNPGCAVGTYTGDGNTNGPAVNIGFKPRFVIIKRTDVTGSWYVFEDQADPTSPHSKYNVLTGGAIAEATTTNAAGGVDFTSTGFQSIDAAAADINISGATYLYLAVA